MYVLKITFYHKTDEFLERFLCYVYQLNVLEDPSWISSTQFCIGTNFKMLSQLVIDGTLGMTSYSKIAGYIYLLSYS